MTIVSSTGQRVLKAVKLTTATATTIATAAQKSLLTLDSLNVSAGAAGSTCTLWVTDGTNIYNIWQAKALAAASDTLLQNHHVVLYSGWSLRIQAGTANQLDVTAIFFQSNQSS